MAREKNIIICVVLCFVTFGIYPFIWMITINDDVNEICGAADPGGLVVVLLTFVTFGIYGIYWHYKIGEKLDF